MWMRPATQVKPNFANPYNGAPTTGAATRTDENLNPSIIGHMEVGRKPPQRHLRASKSKGGGGAPPRSPWNLFIQRQSTGHLPPLSQGTKNTLEMLVVVRVGLGVQTMLWSYVSDLNQLHGDCGSATRPDL